MTRRNILRSLLAGALLVSALPAVAAEDSLARVEAWLQSVKTLSADFVQVVRSRDDQISSRVTGRLSLARPDRFRWDYRDPYVQVIVADGRKLWLYDADLEQVTVRPLEAGLGSTPAMLLSGSGSVGESFTGGPVERDGEWTWCRLVPKQRGSDFESEKAAWSCIQYSGSVPKACARTHAVRGVTPRRPWTISRIVFSESPTCRARAACVTPRGPRNFSSRTCPGCGGFVSMR